MKDLIDSLAINGHATDSVKLSSIISNTMQDAQYSFSAREHANIIVKYESQYGDHTVTEIRALYAIQQMEECIANEDPNSGWDVMSALSKAYNALPLASPLREDARAMYEKAMNKWH
jgi:hypothetical protein